MIRENTKHGIYYRCDKCLGLATGIGVLYREFAQRDFVADLWQKARRRLGSSSKECPHCQGLMSAVTRMLDGAAITFDICPHCQAIWFDSGEFQKLPKEKPKQEPPAEQELSPRAREALALAIVRGRYDRQSDYLDSDTWPDTWWQTVLGFLGFPIELNHYKRESWPILTWSLAGFMVMVFILSSFDARNIITTLGFVPAKWYRLGGLTLFTSFILHANISHLVSNLYIFLLVGDNVEDFLGKGKYVLLLVSSHLAGTVLHAALDPNGNLPVIGASAGIFGILAYYTLTFPRVKFKYLFFIYWQIRWYNIPIYAVFAFYLFLQLFYIIPQLHGQGHVSALGHAGGLAVGLSAGFYTRFVSRRRAEMEAI